MTTPSASTCAAGMPSGRRSLRPTVDVVELRAGVVIGAGSASFEMLRYLVDVLPIMVTPRWVTTRCQPIAISDILELLVEAITHAGVLAGIYEVGGPDVVTYAEMMALYAQVAGLPRRRLIPVPVLTPGLSSHWVGLVTPVPVRLARELVESLVNEVVVTDCKAAETFSFKPVQVARCHRPKSRRYTKRRGTHLLRRRRPRLLRACRHRPDLVRWHGSHRRALGDQFCRSGSSICHRTGHRR